MDHEESQAQRSSAAPQKRKRAPNDNGAGRAVKHRSSLACQSCRTRKVRCDYLTNGPRCTNCKLDNVECIVLASRRGKNNSNRRSSAISDGRLVSPSQPKSVSDAAPQTGENQGWTTSDSLIRSDTGPVPACVTFDQDSDQVGSEQQPEDDDFTNSGSHQETFDAYEGLLTPETTGIALLQRQLSGEKALLPHFIAPLSPQILNEDLAFLRQKGALAIPAPDLQVEILRSYGFSVHPFMPMLNFRSFAHAILGTREDVRISLLLFQAVMFAGLHSLPTDIIHRLGFETAKQAREVFFDRVRLLYEFDVEPDNAAVLQSLILMSSWYSTTKGRRHTWHWTGLAYDLARSMGLHREPTANRFITDEVRRFRRRMWWSLYIRDRMITLGVRRPMRISDDSFDVAMLTLEDFDLEPLPEFPNGQGLTPSVEENTSTALMCIEIAKLCVLVGHVVSSQYTTLSAQSNVPHTMVVLPRRDEGRTQELERCEKELSEWYQDLGANVRRTQPGLGSKPHDCAEVHWCVLNITYLTAINVLYRAQALQPPPETKEAQMVHKSAKSKVKDAARDLTKISQNMLQQDQLRFLGLIGVTALIAACLSHMLDVSSGNEDVRDASTFRLHQSLEVLQYFRGIYASADAAVSFLASVARSAGVAIPAEVAAHPTDAVSASAAGLVKASTGGTGIWGRDSIALLNGHGPAAGMSSRTGTRRESDRAANGHAQLRTQVNGETQGLGHSALSPTASSQTLSSSRVAFPPLLNGTTVPNQQTPGMMMSSPATVPGMSQLTGISYDKPFGTDMNGATFDWNHGMELEPMAFNYDFYSDAFGMLDGHFQGL